MGRHTILLVQFSKNEQTKKWSDHETTPDALATICNHFEEKLRRDKPNMKEITYDGSDLLKFVEEVSDLAILVYSPQDKTYVPYGKNWIKEQLLNHLKRQISN
jgi:hypothetical protein